MNAIELAGLTKHYGAARGIDDVSFAVPAGTIFDFIGPDFARAWRSRARIAATISAILIAIVRSRREARA